MDREGFRQLLQKRSLTDDKIETSLALAERFEEYLTRTSNLPDGAATWGFSKLLIQQGQNTYDNLLTLARYGRFTHNNDIYIAALELLDGAEAQPNLYQKVGELYGEAVRDEVFAGVGVTPLGTPSSEKPAYMFPVIERLIEKMGQAEIEKMLSDCLRTLPDEYYQDEPRRYQESSGIDDYLQKRHLAFVQEIQNCQQQGQLFFSQEITDEVVEYVRNNPEIESGVRQGNIIYVTKIPYNAKQYLAERDPVLKRYYACHCPWAREAVKSGRLPLNASFCSCSGGFSKKPLEIILGQKLQVDTLESVLKGDFRCRFAIHLPETLETA